MRGRMLVAGLAAVLLLGACSSDDSGGDDDAADDTTATTEAGESTTTTAAPAEPLRILVSNDDGHEGVGEGLDALVEGLTALDDVEVTVSIPLQDRTGSSDTSEPGEQPTSEVETLSGHPATAVDGYPADAVEQGIATMAEPPHVVVTGINFGQNIGPLTELSGTVGAARTGARNGIPALAVSQGIFTNGGPDPDYPAAVALAQDWIEEHRDDLVAAGPIDGIAEVTNLNVPTCPSGEQGELLEVPVATEAEVAGLDYGAVDCESGPDADVSNDVTAFLAGHPVQSELTA
jgi:5'-nucleotidase